MYYERTIAPVIQKISETFPVLIVTGPRQVGKTTLLTHLAERSKDRVPGQSYDPRVRKERPGIISAAICAACPDQ